MQHACVPFFSCLCPVPPCRRPQQPSDSIHCPQPVVWRQWLVQLAPEGQQVDQQLFDYVPVDPANVTWGQKPGGKAPAAAAAPALVKAGKRMLQRWVSGTSSV